MRARMMPRMPDKLRVALFSSEYPPYTFGGLGTHVVQITSALAGSVTFEMFVPERKAYQEPPPGVRIHQIPVPRARTNVEFWIRYCRRAIAVAAETLSEQVDLIHCHDWMTGLAGIGLRKALGVPLIVNVHLPQIAGLPYHMENLGVVGADRVLVNSHAVQEELADRSLPIRQIGVVPNGVDLVQYIPAPDWPRDDGYILFVGRFVAQKGVDVLLKAFAAVLQRCAEARLLIVGDGDLELYFRRVAHHLGFPHRASFIGWQTGSMLVEMYQKAQFVVVPSYYEPFGIVALEAMACGRPVIAARVGGLEEIIEDGVQGYLTPKGDHLRMAQRMVDLLLNPARREAMGQAGRTWSAQFSWEKVGEATLAVYRDIVGQSLLPHPPQITSLQEILLEDLKPNVRRIAKNLLGACFQTE
jgi:glycosyltransferase involved in cell wall biosynthesis